jgi:Tfp pilus assembly protein PilZ
MDGRKVIAVPLDLSEGGARLLVKDPFEVGEEIILNLEAPAQQRQLIRRGQVVWAFQVSQMSYAMGVCWAEHLCKDDFRRVTIHPVRLDY